MFGWVREDVSGGVEADESGQNWEGNDQSPREVAESWVQGPEGKEETHEDTNCYEQLIERAGRSAHGARQAGSEVHGDYDSVESYYDAEEDAWENLGGNWEIECSDEGGEDGEVVDVGESGEVTESVDGAAVEGDT